MPHYDRRMQSLPGCAPVGQSATRLTYAVEIKPKGFLPVRLIEGRIASDLKSNLEAIRDYVEKISLSKVKERERQIESNEKIRQLAQKNILIATEETSKLVEASSTIVDTGKLAVETLFNDTITTSTPESIDTSNLVISQATANMIEINISNPMPSVADLTEDNFSTGFSFTRLLYNTFGIDLTGTEAEASEKEQSMKLSEAKSVSANANVLDIQQQSVEMLILIKANEDLKNRVIYLENQVQKRDEILNKIKSLLVDKDESVNDGIAN